MRRHIVLLLVVLMLCSITGAALAGSASGDVQYSTGGVAIIAGEALAAAETPPEAVSYAASLLRGG